MTYPIKNITWTCPHCETTYESLDDVNKCIEQCEYSIETEREGKIKRKVEETKIKIREFIRREVDELHEKLDNIEENQLNSVALVHMIQGLLKVNIFIKRMK